MVEHTLQCYLRRVADTPEHSLEAVEAFDNPTQQDQHKVFNMSHSIISHCRVEFASAVGVQEKLRLREDDEVAIEWMQQLIHESSSNAMAGFMEATHRIAQALR